ncbi:MAG: tetratricopeptide repeat protein [Parvularculaceae bacterium]|nr:tetratricopeptide repeat protein [Parvularculaceae bacterium]
MKTLHLLGVSILWVMAASPAAAQMAITTFGATDAVQCFENARDDFSSDSGPCDRALDDAALTGLDEMRTRVNRGVIYNRTGELAAAIEDFDAALAMDDAAGEAWLNRGNSYFLMGDLDQALADYETALENDVSQPWSAWYNVGLVYLRRNEADKARAAFEKSLQLNPGFAPSQAELEELQGD